MSLSEGGTQGPLGADKSSPRFFSQTPKPWTHSCPRGLLGELSPRSSNIKQVEDISGEYQPPYPFHIPTLCDGVWSKFQQVQKQATLRSQQTERLAEDVAVALNDGDELHSEVLEARKQKEDLLTQLKSVQNENIELDAEIVELTRKVAETRRSLYGKRRATTAESTRELSSERLLKQETIRVGLEREVKSLQEQLKVAKRKSSLETRGAEHQLQALGLYARNAAGKLVSVQRELEEVEKEIQAVEQEISDLQQRQMRALEGGGAASSPFGIFATPEGPLMPGLEYLELDIDGIAALPSSMRSSYLRHLSTHFSKLTLLSEVLQSTTSATCEFNRSLDLFETQEWISQCAASLMGCLAGRVLLWDRVNCVLRCPVMTADGQQVETRFGDNEGLTGIALQQCRTVSAHHLADDGVLGDDAPDVDHYQNYPLHSLMVCPIVSQSSGKKVLGVLQLFNKRHDKPFSETDTFVIQYVVLQAAAALETAIAADDAVRREEAARKLAELAASLFTCTTLEDLAVRVRNHVRTSLDVHCSTLHLLNEPASMDSAAAAAEMIMRMGRPIGALSTAPSSQQPHPASARSQMSVASSYFGRDPARRMGPSSRASSSHAKKRGGNAVMLLSGIDDPLYMVHSTVTSLPTFALRAILERGTVTFGPQECAEMAEGLAGSKVGVLRHALMCPIVDLDNNLVGVLALGRGWANEGVVRDVHLEPSLDYFSPQLCDQVELLCRQIGVAAQNTRLISRLESMPTLLKDIPRNVTLHEAGLRTREAVMAVCPCEDIRVLLRLPNSQLLADITSPAMTRRVMSGILSLVVNRNMVVRAADSAYQMPLPMTPPLQNSPSGGFGISFQLGELEADIETPSSKSPSGSPTAQDDGGLFPSKFFTMPGYTKPGGISTVDVILGIDPSDVGGAEYKEEVDAPIGGQPMRSMMWMPVSDIHRPSHTLAVIMLVNKESGKAFDRQDLLLMRGVASQTSVMLHSAMLLAGLEDRTRLLKYVLESQTNLHKLGVFLGRNLPKLAHIVCHSVEQLIPNTVAGLYWPQARISSVGAEGAKTSTTVEAEGVQEGGSVEGERAASVEVEGLEREKSSNSVEGEGAQSNSVVEAEGTQASNSMEPEGAKSSNYVEDEGANRSSVDAEGEQSISLFEASGEKSYGTAEGTKSSFAGEESAVADVPTEELPPEQQPEPAMNLVHRDPARDQSFASLATDMPPLSAAASKAIATGKLVSETGAAPVHMVLYMPISGSASPGPFGVVSVHCFEPLTDGQVGMLEKLLAHVGLFLEVKLGTMALVKEPSVLSLTQSIRSV